MSGYVKPKCPHCGSEKLHTAVREGSVTAGDVKGYDCRDCGKYFAWRA